eukprot:TRINITY_DN66452_c2_g1_i2.p1 TRINITY_DN66452_c2_g1~~TRINITY_DN66452_c2_g1_i2.p1  ORF type:complete len:450 (+),score=41.65 TRINITY_DN66452_c2_g1_i2:241-1590(+)
MPRRQVSGGPQDHFPLWALTEDTPANSSRRQPNQNQPEPEATTYGNNETPSWLLDEQEDEPQTQYIGGLPVQKVAGVYANPVQGFPSGGATHAQPGAKSRHRSTRGRNFVTDAVDKVGPAVVKIDTTRKMKVNVTGIEDFLKFFLGPDVNFKNEKDFEKVRGFGSGVIISASGKVLTNAHVVAKADKVKATLTDGRQFNATVLGMDEIIDLAVLQLHVDKKNLPSAELGDSSNLLVGAWAIAIGNALGMSSSVTLGIISSLNRTAFEVGIPDKRVEYIQTDAAINPGNSGGPLVDEFGQVIGLNTAIRAGATGVGFAIPISTCKAALPVLERGGQLQHPYLGIHMGAYTSDLAAMVFGPGHKDTADLKRGVLVLRVMDRSPAGNAGLKRGDVLIEFDGKRLVDTEQLLQLLSNCTVGKKVNVKVRRGRDTKSFPVTVGDAKKNIDVAFQ